MWPDGKTSAVVFSIDDIHPGRSTGAYEAGGDLQDGVLGRLLSLLMSHENLKATLFITPDWREICPFPTRAISNVPWIRKWFYLTRVLPKGTMSLDRHLDFTRYLRQLPRCEFSLHGLHHVSRGERVPVEYQSQSLRACMRSLRCGQQSFQRAGLGYSRGFCPPAWNMTPNLLTALVRESFAYFSAAKDIDSSVSVGALSQGSGPRDVPAFIPSIKGDRGIVHIPVNFQATSSKDRAFRILDQGGLLSIKAHAIENACGHIALDALNGRYVDFLDQLIVEIEAEFGSTVWWATFNEVADQTMRQVSDGAGSIAVESEGR